MKWRSAHRWAWSYLFQHDSREPRYLNSGWLAVAIKPPLGRARDPGEAVQSMPRAPHGADSRWTVPGRTSLVLPPRATWCGADVDDHYLTSRNRALLGHLPLNLASRFWRKAEMPSCLSS